MPEMITILVGDGEGTEEPEAKGVAECSNMVAAPAIANAIAHATGHRVLALPARLPALLPARRPRARSMAPS